MKKKLSRSILLVSVAVVLLTLGLVLPRLYAAFEQRAFEEMRNVSAVLAGVLNLAQDKAQALWDAAEALPQVRVSWIAGTGSVLLDSGIAELSGLENHADREEVLEALAGGEGEAIRRSSSLGENTHYYARRLSDGTVLRVAKTSRTVWAELGGLVWYFALLFLLAIAVSALLARLLTVRLVGLVNRLDLDHPEENDVDEELTPLLRRLSEQNRRINEQMDAIRENARKTEAITENMTEGVIMVSARRHIVSINHSAARLFGGTREAFCGKHYMEASRDMGLHDAIEQALSGTKSERRIAMSDRVLHLLADPVNDGGTLAGVVILLLDITKAEQAEAARREFSANVSHELKTPLTTIAGYAEMMRAGLADTRDNERLADTILSEARRLLSLIEDIIKLSRLDEGAGGMAFEPVDLHALAQTVASRMQGSAQARHVSLRLRGEAAFAMGSPVLLGEMLQNLLDNAIRYNRDGGTVEISVRADGRDTVIAIEDTGVGIAPEHHARIFERFYRVDKSHSRATGGTGLGLAIVKHTVQNHGGAMTLESVPGKGTTVVVMLPGMEGC